MLARSDDTSRSRNFEEPVGNSVIEGDNLNRAHRRAGQQSSADGSGPRRFEARLGTSVYNIPNQVNISGSYELAFGKGKLWANNLVSLGDRLVSRWHFNSIVTLESGFLFTPQVGSNRSSDGDTRTPIRLSLNPAFCRPVVLGNPNGWFNPNAFILTAAGTYGKLGRGLHSGPGLTDVNASLFKDTAITERTNLQFRAEFSIC